MADIKDQAVFGEGVSPKCTTEEDGNRQKLWPAELRGVRPRNLEQSRPPSLRAPELSLSTFKRLLKTQLFQHA